MLGARGDGGAGPLLDHLSQWKQCGNSLQGITATEQGKRVGQQSTWHIAEQNKPVTMQGQSWEHPVLPGFTNTYKQ
jgi:hypothetical protein